MVFNTLFDRLDIRLYSNSMFKAKHVEWSCFGHAFKIYTRKKNQLTPEPSMPKTAAAATGYHTLARIFF